jgi:bifunctional non-homologous end joining protein LigD
VKRIERNQNLSVYAFRSLAYLDDGHCKLVSRSGNEFKSFAALNLALPLECGAQVAVLDGEIVCLDKTGTSQFTNLLFRRGEPRYYAFDLLFSNGEDFRYLLLADRKHRLHDLLASKGERLLYCDHVESKGEELFHLACQRDLEGVVAKRKFDPYLPSASWLKIRNRKYSQWLGREELFEQERHEEPVAGWHTCAIACAGLETII